jgi:hypothetical protein
MTLNPLVTDALWELPHLIRLGPGLTLPARMTVLRLPDGGLALHSPVPLTDEDVAELAALGPVHVLLAPNNWHHLFLPAAAARYPEAAVWGAPGVVAKQPTVRFDGLLDGGQAGTPPWSDGLTPIFLAGAPACSETAFVHKATRTAVLTDALFNLQDGAPGLLSQLVHRLFGTWGRTFQSRLWRRSVKDRPAMAASVEAVLAQDFDRLVMAHGHVIETGGKAALREAAAWLGVAQVPRA